VSACRKHTSYDGIEVTRHAPCDATCSELGTLRAYSAITKDLNAALSDALDRLAQADRMVALWDKWEGRVILDPASWTTEGGFTVTGSLYDDYVMLQTKRGKFRDKAHG